MDAHRLIVGLAIVGGAWPATAVAQIPVPTPGFQTLYSFSSYDDGVLPLNVIVDPATGDLYGATRSGGMVASRVMPALFSSSISPPGR